MSISDLLIPGRKAWTNIYVNSTSLAQLTTAEKIALNAPNGTLVYDSDLNNLFIRINGNWDEIQSTQPGGGAIALIGPTATVNIPVTALINPCAGNNISAPILNGGMTLDNTNGFVHVPSTGYYRVYAQAAISPQNPNPPLTAGALTINIANQDGTILYFRTTNNGFTAATSSLAQWTIQVSGIIQLNAGDGLAMFISTVSLSAPISVAVISNNPKLTYMTIEEL